MKKLPLEMVFDELKSLNKNIVVLINQEKPLNYTEASKFLGVTKRTLQNAVSKKTVPHYKSKIGVYFYASELNKSIKYIYRCIMEFLFTSEFTIPVLALVLSFYLSVKIGFFIKKNDLIADMLLLERKQTDIEAREAAIKNLWDEYIEVKNNFLSLKRELETANETAKMQAVTINNLYSKIREYEIDKTIDNLSKVS